MNFIKFTATIFVFLYSISSISQSSLKTETSATYTSDLDNLFSIKNITVLPSSDNTQGIYARPIEDEIKTVIKSDHRFQLVDSQFVGSEISPEELDQDAELVKKLSQNISTDALIASRVFKGSDGINFHISLFLKADGKLISHEIYKEKNTFDIKQAKSRASEIVKKLIKQIPYDGVVLSRSQTLVTINLGKRNGLASGQIVTAVVLLKTNRHPKLNFIISTEKEILGKIRLDKVDDTISFGKIITEKDIGSIQKGNKISGIDFVSYSGSELGNTFKDSSEDSKLKDISFGNSPKEWRPADPPSFGKAGISVGLGRARYSSTHRTDGASSVDDGFYIPVKLTGELWITPLWFADAEIEQAITTGDPNLNVSNYSLAFGYNFMVQDDFFGPSIVTSLGFSSYNVDVESSSGLSSTAYSGIFLRLKGYVPVSQDNKWFMGGMLQYYIKTNYTDSPSSGGSDDNTITKFSLLGFHQLNTKMRITGSLDFSAFSSNFTGGTRADTSQKFTTLTGGAEYLF